MPPPDPTARTYGRRTFLAVVAGGASSLVWGGSAWRAAEHALHPLARALPANLRAIVPSEGWRIYTVADTMPTFDRARWRLTIDGLVERRQSLRYDDLLALPAAEQVSTFHCVTGWTVTQVRWRGVRFRDLLAVVRPTSQARALQFVSAERPYTDSLDLEQAFLHDALLAYEMDGKPLARRARFARASGDPGDVWVQEREVG